MSSRAELSKLTGQIIGAAIEVRRHLGPGLLESAYETCLACELQKLGLAVERQKALPLVYKEIRLDQGYRIDLLVEQSVIVELKVVDQIAPVHEAQVLSYLRFSGCKVGLLLNFNVKLLKDGIRRFIMTQAAAEAARDGRGSREISCFSLCNSVSPPCSSV
jgi:GxxExxY protein